MRNICVAHLVRAQNGVEPLKCFIESYLRNEAGIDHDLLIIFKGFSSADSKSDYLQLLKVVQYESFDVPDTGYDITAYFTVSKHYGSRYQYFCFLNSFSVIRDRGWLKKLYERISEHEVGLVGATSSWQSHRHSGPFWLLLGMGVATVRYYLQHREAPLWEKMVQSVMAGLKKASFLCEVDSFPNYHLRTNVFMIPSEIMSAIALEEIKTKLDAYKFESGKNSLTKQVRKMGKKILVVGKDGVGYEMTQWSESNTFWKSEQENLLVSDNQTEDYQQGNIERKRFLSQAAWGKKSHTISNRTK